MEPSEAPAPGVNTGAVKPAKPKRIRKSRSRGLRTKTGCLTCRKRHKKCDERVPICGPCSISSRDCVYGDEPNPASDGQPIQQAKPGTPNQPAKTPSPALTFASRREIDIPRTIPEVPPPSHPAGPPPAGPSPRNLYPSPVEVPQLPLPPPPPPPPPSTIPLAEAYQYAYSPDTVASELLTTDMASNRWLDLLATDAAQADAGFSLAPSPAPEDSVSNTGHESQPIGTENQPISGSVSIPAPLANQAAERHAWSLNRDIVLTSYEATLFRTFAERASLWLDIFDPRRHFSTYATRLALRNVGLMKAILALCARHREISEANAGITRDSSLAVQYYYETLHYLQNALQYNSYTHSEELLGTALVISTYEMLDSSDTNWKRHLKGVFWIQRSQDVNGASGGLRQSVWWAWLRQDIWAAFRERRRCFSFWRPLRDYGDLNQDELADRVVYLLSQTVNYCSKWDPSPTEPDTTAKRIRVGEALISELERWKTYLGPLFQPLPTADPGPESVFQPLWVHPPKYGVALQVYSFACILITLHRPAASGFDGYLKTQKTLSEAVNTICGIAMELRDEGSQIMSAQCLFGAGLCVQDADKRNVILSLIDSCELRTGWPMASMKKDLLAEWAK
ncbi:putative Zn(II)2Cys6 transcription factor [Pestalotiopsis sp. NC0098]|nr:putative Zn(II)2Cys6 transcription factor [Pestalotiopsis sp. NC0098]